jgi:hypothetical protein
MKLPEITPETPEGEGWICEAHEMLNCPKCVKLDDGTSFNTETTEPEGEGE